MKKLKRVSPARVVYNDPKPARLFMPHSFANQVEFIDGGPPMVYMTRDAFSRMWHFVDIADEEVGWLGTVRQTRYGNFLIEEVFLLEQEVSAAQTEISEDGIAKLAQELIETRPDGVDVANSIHFWGHSHVRMGTSPSGQDETQMRHFQQNDCPWFVRGILNKLGRMQFDIFLWDAGVKITDAPWAIYDEFVDQSRRAEMGADFKAKGAARSYASYHYTGPHSQTPWPNGVPPQFNNGARVMVVHSATDNVGDNNVG